VQALVQVLEGIGLCRVARRAGGLDGDVWQLRQRAELVEIAKRRFVFLKAQQAAMIDDQFQRILYEGKNSI
jgi:hypothetical protein